MSDEVEDRNDLIKRAQLLRTDAFERWQTHDTQENWDEYLDRQAQLTRLQVRAEGQTTK